jgi:predicted nucleotide-binding protein (sugar kinase/HSP70/actin superfamily)
LEFIAQFAKDHERLLSASALDVAAVPINALPSPSPRSVKEGVLFCCHMAVSCLPALASHEGCAQLMEYINKTMSSEREELEGGLKTRLGISQ